MEMLDVNGFYDMLFILLMKKRHNTIVEKAFSQFVADKIVKDTKENGIEKIFEGIKQKMNEEAIKESRIRESNSCIDQNPDL